MTHKPTPPPAPPIAIPLRWVRVAHHSPEHIAARYPYAAFGSNLNLGQMARRCPQADIMGAGILRSARLVFARYLGIVEDTAATVPVGVYRLTGPDIAALDRFEGHGRHYDRYLVTVEVNGEAVRCFTYVKRDNAPRAPSDTYYAACLQGYVDWAFDSRRLRHARDYARKNEKPIPPSHGERYSSKRFDFSDWYKATFVARNDARDSDDAIPENVNGAPHVSLVTGRMLPGKRPAPPRRLEDMRPDEIRSALNGQRAKSAPIGKQESFVDDAGQRWTRRGDGTAWYRTGGK